jgi:hypothetical protein
MNEGGHFPCQGCEPSYTRERSSLMMASFLASSSTSCMMWDSNRSFSLRSSRMVRFNSQRLGRLFTKSFYGELPSTSYDPLVNHESGLFDEYGLGLLGLPPFLPFSWAAFTLAGEMDFPPLRPPRRPSFCAALFFIRILTSSGRGWCRSQSTPSQFCS